MGFIKEFKDFALRGNLIDFAVGVVVGGAFTKITASFVSNIVMPPLNLLTARYGVNFSDMAFKVNTLSPKLNPDGSEIKNPDGSRVLAEQAYPILKYGPFIQTVVDFLLIAFAVFLVIKAINTAKARFEKQKEAAPAPAPPEEILLLREIRDSLMRTSPRRVEE